jgi:hypothetical protein
MTYTEIVNAPYEPFRFKQDDGGRAQSRRPRQKNDCTVRALAVTLGIEYDFAYEVLASFGRKSGAGFPFKTHAAAIFANCSADATWTAFQAVKGERRLTLPAFCARYPAGRYIVSMAKHITVVVDGVVHDDFQPGEERCVYGAWRVQPAPAKVLAEGPQVPVHSRSFTV